MKRRYIIVLALLLTSALIITMFSGCSFKGFITNKIYNPQNVYEEIWNLVLIEEYTRKKTVLTTQPKNAELDFDLGIHFVGIYIHDCNLCISWYKEGEELSFYFFGEQGKGDAQFIYNYKAKTLYGDADFSYYMKGFLTDYFEWCNAATDFSSAYSVENLGNAGFQYVDPIWQYKHCFIAGLNMA